MKFCVIEVDLVSAFDNEFHDGTVLSYCSGVDAMSTVGSVRFGGIVDFGHGSHQGEGRGSGVTSTEIARSVEQYLAGITPCVSDDNAGPVPTLGLAVTLRLIKYFCV